MRTSLRIVAIAVAVSLGFTCFSDAVWAQRRGRGGGDQRSGERAGSSRSRLPSPEFDTVPFDATREQLPQVYLGHNIQLLYSSIKNAPRGTTETDSLGQTYAFQVRPAENFYNARDNNLEVYCELSSVVSKGREDSTRKGLRVLYIPQADNHFTYTDASGTKIEIEQVKFSDYTIVFENVRGFSVEKAMLPSIKQAKEKASRKGNLGNSSDEALNREVIVGTFKIDPREAPQLEESVTALAVCNLAEPYATAETVQKVGTKEKPGEYLAEHHYLHVRLVALWFYDFLTGKVFLKIKPDERS